MGRNDKEKIRRQVSVKDSIKQGTKVTMVKSSLKRELSRMIEVADIDALIDEEIMKFDDDDEEITKFEIHTNNFNLRN